MAIHRSTKYITIATFLVTSIVTCLGFVIPNIHNVHWCDIMMSVVGVLAMTYVVYFLAFFGIEKVPRDVILMKKNYWVWILLLVVALPFVFTWIILLLNISTMQLMDEGNPYVMAVAEGDARGVSILWSVFFHYIDAGNLHVSAGAGRLMAGIIGLFGLVLFNGLLVSTILNWTARRKEQWDNGEIRYPLSSLSKGRFAVVVGANEMAVSIVKELLQIPPKQEKRLDYSYKQGNEYVILQTCSDVSTLRERLSAQLTDQELDRVICYRALRNSQKEIEQLYLPYVSTIYILGESSVGLNAETAHDALNMRTLNLMAQVLYKHKMAVGEQRYEKKNCQVMFDYHTTSAVFQFSDVTQEVKDTMYFSPFDIYETWARKLLVDNQAYNYGHPIHYTPLDGYDGIRSKDDKRVHLVIIGMSKMGVALAEQTLYQAHYLNYDKQRTRITLIDSAADKQMEFFKGGHAVLFELMRYRYVDAKQSLTAEWIDPMMANDCQWKHLSDHGTNFIDTEVEFVKGDVESDAIRAYLREISKDTTSKLTIAVCLNHTNQALAASLYLPIEVYESSQLQDIWVYQREVMDIVGNLTDKTITTTSIRYKKLRPFGMLNGEKIENHPAYLKALLVNTAYDVICCHRPWPKDMGDTTEEGFKNAYQSWDKLLVNKKWSNYFFVDTMHQKLRGIYMPLKLQELLQQSASEGDQVALGAQLRAVAIIGGYNDAMYDDSNWQKEIEAAIEHNMHALAICEHNRWNMEQLMMGYSPCKKADDDKLKELILNGQMDEQSQMKKALKLSAAKVHPNICDYEHLTSVDPFSKEYDSLLIREIPKILMMVDGYGMCQYES